MEDFVIIKINQLISELKVIDPLLDIRSGNSNIYSSLKMIRTLARQEERKKGVLSSSNWENLSKQIVELISNGVRDLEVCAWLIESMIRINGFEGLFLSLELLHKIIFLYKDDIKSLSSGQSHPFSFLYYLNENDTLSLPISLCPFIFSSEKIGISLWIYQQAFFHKNSDLDNSFFIENNLLSYDEITRISKEIDVSELDSLLDLIQKSLVTINNIEDICFEVSKNDAPCFDEISAKLKECISTINAISTLHTPHYIKNESYQIPASYPKTFTISEERGLVISKLKECSAYFKSVEPHSPIPYLLEKAILWASLSFPALLKELVHDDMQQKQISQLLGLSEEV